MDREMFKKNPRGYAVELMESGAVSAEQLLLAAIVYMSLDDVRGFLDANELSPRFLNLNEDE